MTQELIYTSVPQGLVPGSRGFCTVAQTSGIPAALQERLEALSGYRHLFEPQDPRAHNNPAAWSHYIFTVSGIRYHALSRVADAGLDYSQRSSKLAHHFALEAAERNSAGPAWCLRQPNFLHTKWEGTPRLLPPGRVLPQGSSLPATCSAWQRVVGDAGWAGILVESLFTQREAYLLYQPGTNVLDLIAEAIALLPPEKRWDVTFQTYFTRIPAGVECRWKGVIAGSEAETVARRSAGALLIDLTRKQPVPQENAAVTAARLGQTIDSRTAQPPSEPSLDLSPLPVTRPNKPLRTVAQRPGAPDYELSPLGSLVDLATSSPELNPPGGWDPRGAQRIERRTGLWVSVAVLAMLLLTGGIAGWFYRSGFFDSMPTVKAGLVAEGDPAVSNAPLPTPLGQGTKTIASRFSDTEIQSYSKIADDYLAQLPAVEKNAEYTNKLIVELKKHNTGNANESIADDKLEKTIKHVAKQQEKLNENVKSVKDISQFQLDVANKLKVLRGNPAFDKNLELFKQVELKGQEPISKFLNHYAAAVAIETDKSIDWQTVLVELDQRQVVLTNRQQELNQRLAWQVILSGQSHFDLKPTPVRDIQADPPTLIKLPKLNVQEIDIKLENCPKYELVLDKTNGRVWNLNKIPASDAGFSKQHGKFSIANNILQFEPDQSFSNEISKELLPGVLTLTYKGRDPYDIPLQTIQMKPPAGFDPEGKDLLLAKVLECLGTPCVWEYHRSKSEEQVMESKSEEQVMECKLIPKNQNDPEENQWKLVPLVPLDPLDPLKNVSTWYCQIPHASRNILKFEVLLTPYTDIDKNSGIVTDQVKIEFSPIHVIVSKNGIEQLVEVDSFIKNNLSTYIQDLEYAKIIKDKNAEITSLEKDVNAKNMEKIKALRNDINNIKKSIDYNKMSIVDLDQLWPEKYVELFEAEQKTNAALTWTEFLTEKIRPYKEDYELSIKIYRVIHRTPTKPGEKPSESIKFPFPLKFQAK